MDLSFDLKNVKTTEFGVGRDSGDEREFVLVPADAKVQAALREMAGATWAEMQNMSTAPSVYEPSDKHGSLDYVYIPLADDLCGHLRQLYEASNLPLDSKALSDPAIVFCYFINLYDSQGRRLTALRRATQFKGVLKNPLITVVTDALKIIEDKVFKLDADFDLLIDAENVHILRPSAFEFVGQLKEAVMAAAPANVKAIAKDIPFVDFGYVEEYAIEHPRAARYLASIRAQKETGSVDREALERLCQNTGVKIAEKGGRVCVEEGHVMGFLEVLDRRRYEVELVKESPERYRAPSRQRLGSPPAVTT